MNARFPRQDKKTVPFPRRPTNSELNNTARDCFWTKYTFDLAKYGYRPALRDFTKFFADHTYPSWESIIASYNRLITSIINGEEPSIPHDLVYDYAKEKEERAQADLERVKEFSRKSLEDLARDKRKLEEGDKN